MSAQTPGGAHTPGQTRTEFMSPAASLRSISARLEVSTGKPQDSGKKECSWEIASVHPLSPQDEQQQQRRTSTGAAQWPASQGHATAQLLAAKDAEAAVLRQQLAQLTADFRYNLKLLEERDLDLERMDAVLSSLRQAAAVKDAAAAEASTELAASRSALRDKEATLAALEERHRAALELCDRQVADARAARDEEVARVTAELAAVQGRAAKQHSDTVAREQALQSAAWPLCVMLAAGMAWSVRMSSIDPQACHPPSFRLRGAADIRNSSRARGACSGGSSSGRGRARAQPAGTCRGSCGRAGARYAAHGGPV